MDLYQMVLAINYLAPFCQPFDFSIPLVGYFMKFYWHVRSASYDVISDHITNQFHLAKNLIAKKRKRLKKKEKHLKKGADHF